MLVFYLLVILTGLSALLAAVSWVRVAASHSLHRASELDGTERLFERANRRALTRAAAASGLTLLLAAAVLVAGRSAGAF
jgi:hypothetical protein